jgi:hypothetical protein
VFGGGIANFDFDPSAPLGTVELQNTILALNFLRDAFDQFTVNNCSGVISSLGNNIVDDTTGCSLVLLPSDRLGDPGLRPFNDNGEPGKGHFPLLATSRAIDTGNNQLCVSHPILGTDQLGRPRRGPCDIGAVEFGRTVLNALVTFVPIMATRTTTAHTAGCPAGFVGQFSFHARLTDKSTSPSLTSLLVRVTTLTNGNLLQNADHGPAGAEATLTVPGTGAYTDGVLSPGQFVEVPFRICLKQNKPFSFFVDVLGVAEDE